LGSKLSGSLPYASLTRIFVASDEAVMTLSDCLFACAVSVTGTRGVKEMKRHATASRATLIRLVWGCGFRTGLLLTSQVKRVWHNFECCQQRAANKVKTALESTLFS
jgi:hypothetical protein